MTDIKLVYGDINGVGYLAVFAQGPCGEVFDVATVYEPHSANPLLETPAPLGVNAVASILDAIKAWQMGDDMVRN